MDKPAPHRIERSTLADQQIEMSARTGINGADRSTFVGCEILLLPKGLPAARFGQRFDIGFAKFERCAFRARGTIKKLHLTVRTQLIDCRFEGGPFEFAQFGQTLPPSAPLDGWSSSSIQRCDFRNAELLDAQFYSVAADQLDLPGWPQITLLSPHAAKVSQPEPHIVVSPSAKRDSIWHGMDFISDALERMKSVGPPSVRVMHVREMVPEAELQAAFRERLDELRHPRIRY